MRNICSFILQAGNFVRNEIWKLFNAVTIGVRVIAIKDQKILLVRHTYKGNWHLPGGGVKRKESLTEAAIRELYEETGARVDTLALLDFYTNYAEGRTDHVIVFCGNVVSLDFSKNHEIAEFVFFDLNQIPNNVDGHCVSNIQKIMFRDIFTTKD